MGMGRIRLTVLRNEEWVRHFETNVLGAIKLTRAILPHFRRRKSGKVVFVGSENGWRGSAGTGAYSVSKFALEGLFSLHTFKFSCSKHSSCDGDRIR